jgi:hypothetical protein
VPNYQDFWITKCQIKGILLYMQHSFSTGICWYMGHTVVQLVETQRYKPKGHGFDSRWCHWDFSLTKSSQPHYGPGIYSASNRNKYLEIFCRGKGSWCIGLSTLPAPCADCLEIWKSKPPGTLKACDRPGERLLYLLLWLLHTVWGMCKDTHHNT